MPRGLPQVPVGKRRLPLKIPYRPSAGPATDTSHAGPTNRSNDDNNTAGQPAAPTSRQRQAKRRRAQRQATTHHDQPRAARTTRRAGSTKNGTKDARLKHHQIEVMAHLASPSQHSSGSPPHAPTSPTLASHAAQPSALAPHAPGSASVALGRTASKATRARWDQGSQGFEGAGTHTHSHTHPHTHTRKRFSHGRGV